MLSGVSAAGSREIQYVVALDLARSRGADPRKHEEPVLMSRSEEHTSELQSRVDLVCRLLLEKEKKRKMTERVRADEAVTPDLWDSANDADNKSSWSHAARNPHYPRSVRSCTAPESEDCKRQS